MSPGADTLIQGALASRNLPALFAALPLLRDLDPQQLRDISSDIEWFSLPGGATLFEAGQPADGLYAVVNGALGIYLNRANGATQYAGQVCGGETIGELEVISDQPRTATVIALRDSEVARLSNKSFELLLEKNPQSMRQIARIMAQRIDALQRTGRQTRALPKTFAVVPHGPDVDARAFATQLLECLRGVGRAELVMFERGREQTSHYFHRLERANDYVVYVTDARPTNWSKLCLRQADSLLLLANLGDEPRPWAALAGNQENSPSPQSQELVLLQPSFGAVTRCGEWLDAQVCRRHHLVRDRSDVARIARLVSGRGVGLVLSGGGARGFAHIGVLRALQEAGLAIDAIGGTSIGAIVGAGWAAGWDYPQMVQRIRRAFVDTNPLNDYTLPFVSLVSGRKVSRLLRQAYGDIEIEDLRLPFYCVSANLTSGQPSVHRRGLLWYWLRASAAIPGVLPPVCRHQQVYVDGATINSLPVDVMQDVMSGTIIGVDVSTDRAFATDADSVDVPGAWNFLAWLKGRRSRISMMKILLRAGMINSTATSIGQRQQTDLLLQPPLASIDLLDWRAFERVVDIGYRHAVEAIEQYRSQIAGTTSHAAGAAQGSAGVTASAAPP
jgi:NTE family protein